MAAMELMHTMRPPPCARMTGITARAARSAPYRFSSSCACASSGAVYSAAPEMPKPALHTRISIRPSRRSTSATAACTLASSVMSAVRCSTPGVGAFSRLDEVQQFSILKGQELGATWHFNETATVLLQDESGAVTGAITEGPDGYVKYNASKSLGLAPV